MSALPVRPGGFNVVENDADFRVTQHITKARHVAFIAPADHRGRSVARYAEQDIVAVVPGVAGCIMGRRWQPAIGSGATPVGLAFEVRPMAGSAILLIERRAIHALRCPGGASHA